MEIHVINLKEAVDRRRSIEGQLQKLGLEYKMFEAVRGSSLTQEQLDELVDMDEVRKYPNWLTPNMLGCSLSHMGVYKRMVDSPEEWHLVLEDDVVIDSDLDKTLKHIEERGEKFRGQLVLLYGVSHNSIIELKKAPESIISTKKIYRLLNSANIGSTGAYVIHKETAQKMLEKNDKVKVAPDTWHYFQDQKALGDIYIVYPFAARPGFFESTIGYVNKKRLLFKLKRIIEKYKIPFLHSILKNHRRGVWERTSRVEFK